MFLLSTGGRVTLKCGGFSLLGWSVWLIKGDMLDTWGESKAHREGS
jgi:hypothetical protein